MVGSDTEGFAALLALYHFNNVETSPILNQSELMSVCPDLRLTMSLVDSHFNEIETTRLFTHILESSKTLATPPTTGLIGAYRSAVSLPLAILSGVNNITQISPASSAIDFDDKEQFPLFGRTLCNSIGEALVALEFFKSINSSHVVILFVTVRVCLYFVLFMLSCRRFALIDKLVSCVVVVPGYIWIVFAEVLSGLGQQGKHNHGTSARVLFCQERKCRDSRRYVCFEAKPVSSCVRNLL
jgi:hypothetical protein